MHSALSMFHVNDFGKQLPALKNFEHMVGDGSLEYFSDEEWHLFRRGIFWLRLGPRNLGYVVLGLNMDFPAGGQALPQKNVKASLLIHRVILSDGVSSLHGRVWAISSILIYASQRNFSRIVSRCPEDDADMMAAYESLSFAGEHDGHSTIVFRKSLC